VIRLAGAAQALVHRDASEARRLLAEAGRSAGDVDDWYEYGFVALAIVAAAGAVVDPPAAVALIDAAESRANRLGNRREYALRILAAMLADRQPERAAAVRRAADHVAASSGLYGHSYGELVAGMAVLLTGLGLSDIAAESLATLGNGWARGDALAILASALGRSADPVATQRARRITAGLLRDPNHWWRALRPLADTDPEIARAVGACVLAGAAAVG
jgi:hypothetical protein